MKATERRVSQLAKNYKLKKELNKGEGGHLQVSHSPSFPSSVVRTATVELAFTVYFRK